MELFKIVKVNISVIDEIQLMFVYIKFLKDLCTKKRFINIPKKVFIEVNIYNNLSSSMHVNYKD